MQHLCLLVLLFWSVYSVLPPVVTTAHPRGLAGIPALQTEWGKLKTNSNSSDWYDRLKRHGPGGSSDDCAASYYKNGPTHELASKYAISGLDADAQAAWNCIDSKFISAWPDYSPACWGGKQPSANWPNYSTPDCGDYYGGENTARLLTDTYLDAYDVLYNWLEANNPTGRVTFRNKLGNLIAYVLSGHGTTQPYNHYGQFPIRSTDNDELGHTYMAALKYHIYTADESFTTNHPNSFWGNVYYNLGGVTPQTTDFSSGLVSGHCANGCYNTPQDGEIPDDFGMDMRTSLAATLYKYLRGGVGESSSGYTLEGTHVRMAHNWAAAAHAFGTDYFPEIGEFLLNSGITYLRFTTPDLQAVYRWGDDEATNTAAFPMVAHFQNLNSFAACLSFVDTTSGDERIAYINDGAYKILEANKNNKNYYGFVPYSEGTWAYQDVWSAPKADLNTAVPGGQLYWTDDALGMGVWRSGWAGSDSMFAFEWQNYNFIDHFTLHVGNFQTFRKGEWGMYTPISYGRPTSSGEITNTMNFYGWPHTSTGEMKEYKGILGTDYDDDFAYYIGAQAGSWRSDGDYGTPATWQQEYTRSNLFIHGTHVDISLVFDRSNIVDPTTNPNWASTPNPGHNPNPMPNWWGYNMGEAHFGDPRRLWQWYCHQTPTFNGDTIEWKPAALGFDSGGTPTGYTASTTQTIKLTSHFVATTYGSGGAASGLSGYWPNYEKGGYLVRETVTTETGSFVAGLHVISIFDNGFRPNSSEYKSTNSKAKAVLVSRGFGEKDVFAIYNVQVGPTLNSPGWQNPTQCALSNVPCPYDPENQNIVPTQHRFKAADTGFIFTSVPVRTTSLDIYLNDLNPTQQYQIWIDGSLITGGLTSQSFGFVKASVTTTATVQTICIQQVGDSICASAPTSPGTASPPPSGNGGGGGGPGSGRSCFHEDTKITHKGEIFTLKDFQTLPSAPCVIPHVVEANGHKISTTCPGSLRLTSEHLVFTQRGLITADSIKIGDFLYQGMDDKITCEVTSIVHETSQKYFGLNCADENIVLADGYKTSTFGFIHALPSCWMKYVSQVIGLPAASAIGSMFAKLLETVESLF